MVNPGDLIVGRRGRRRRRAARDRRRPAATAQAHQQTNAAYFDAVEARRLLEPVGGPHAGRTRLSPRPWPCARRRRMAAARPTGRGFCDRPCRWRDRRGAPCRTGRKLHGGSLALPPDRPGRVRAAARPRDRRRPRSGGRPSTRPPCARRRTRPAPSSSTSETGFTRLFTGLVDAGWWSAVAPWTDLAVLIVAGNKPLVYRLLAGNRWPTPRYALFTLRRIGRAAEFLGEVGRPCVVKPATATGARPGRDDWRRPAVTAGLGGDGRRRPRSGTADRGATRRRQLPPALSGWRAGGRRGPPAADGDRRRPIDDPGTGPFGQRRTAARRPARVVNLLAVDLDMRNTLAAAGLSPRSVPAAGAVVTLKTVINQNFGPENASAAHLFCDEVIEAGGGRPGASAPGWPAWTSSRPTRPSPWSGPGVVLEVNTTPGFHHHYHKKDGHYPVAVHVLERC